MTEPTPMLKQYFEIKDQYKDSILFFRLGDFYEMFGQDALIASRILGITLTARNKGRENEIHMCGVPYHSSESYLAKLTRAGYKVAICEQVSNPTLPGIVKRKVIRVVTKGTTFDNQILNNNKNNYLLCLYYDNKIKKTGCSFADLTTGEFKLCEFDCVDDLKNELSKLNPSEIIYNRGLEHINQEIYSLFYDFYHHVYETVEYIKPYEVLKKHFRVRTLNSFGINNMISGIYAAATLLNYLKETQKVDLSHINSITYYNYNECVVLDHWTIKNLELFKTVISNEYKGSLLSILDYTKTPLGARLLRKWLLNPLKDKTAIELRLNAVNTFVLDNFLLNNIVKSLKDISDIERIVGKIGCQRSNARDLVALKDSLNVIPCLKKFLNESKNKYLLRISDQFIDISEVTDLIEQAIIDDPPITITEGNIIKHGYNEKVDELRHVLNSGKDYLENLRRSEIERTKIQKLKIKFNKVFGYYIEISKSNLHLVPNDYVRKQTLVNAERFITPELKKFEEKILGAEEKLNELEYNLFDEVRDKVSEFIKQIQFNAILLAQIDCICGFASLALKNNYCFPQINNRGKIEIKKSRHPVIEQLNTEEQYVPNNIFLNNKDHTFLLITGPNMSGKSSYLRQVALIILMAHIGSFVPAFFADICLVDRIFTRVGAADNLAQGQSTFMVEMAETANIIYNATKNSLIILDELGRGTSTYDGLSLAWAITEYIHNNIKAKTLFATHYHELIDVVKNLTQAQNYSVAVKENEKGVIFLRKLIKGGISKSYGIEVAKLAGIPRDILIRAMKILELMEREEIDFKKLRQGQMTLPFTSSNNSSVDDLKEIYVIINEIKNYDINKITAFEALLKLKQWQERLNKKS